MLLSFAFGLQVGKGTISSDLLQIQLVAFLMAQGNQSCAIDLCSEMDWAKSLDSICILSPGCLEMHSKNIKGLCVPVRLSCMLQLFRLIGGLDRCAAAANRQASSVGAVGLASRIRCQIWRPTRSGCCYESVSTKVVDSVPFGFNMTLTILAAWTEQRMATSSIHANLKAAQCRWLSMCDLETRRMLLYR